MFPPAGGERKTFPAQGTVRAEGADDVLRPIDQQAPEQCNSRETRLTQSQASRETTPANTFTYLALPCIVLLCTLGFEFNGAAMPETMEINKDLMAASSTPIVLAILAEADSYGYAILERVRELSGGRMEWTDGMLYPVLHRLERLGHVKARWAVAESGRRRKYYRITSEGRAQLAEDRRQWQAVNATLRGIWSAFSIPIPDSYAGSAAPLPHGA